jgi:hypothetical protein
LFPGALKMRSVMCINYCLHDWQTIFIILFSSFWTVDREQKKYSRQAAYITYENAMWILGILRFKSIQLLFYTFIHIIHMYISNDSKVILKYFHFVLPIVTTVLSHIIYSLVSRWRINRTTFHTSVTWKFDKVWVKIIDKGGTLLSMSSITLGLLEENDK